MVKNACNIFLNLPNLIQFKALYPKMYYNIGKLPKEGKCSKKTP